MQNYWLLEDVVHIVTDRLLRLKYATFSSQFSQFRKFSCYSAVATTKISGTVFEMHFTVVVTQNHWPLMNCYSAAQVRSDTEVYVICMAFRE
jgi:hypothetical protein